MNDVVGIELGVGTARAAAFAAWRAQPHATLELTWDPERPADLVGQLRERLGATRRIALSVGLGFLHVKHVKLPPAPAVERRRMLALEPDRFFPVQDQAVAVALANDANFAFAVDSAWLERCLAAFSAWAPVDAVEPAPLSLARALGASAQGSFALPAGDGEHGVVELKDGAFRSARRAPAIAHAVNAQSTPAQNGVKPEYLCAAGVAGAVAAPLESMFVPDRYATNLRGRRARRIAASATLCLAAFLFALWSIDRSRERTLARITREVAATAPHAATAMQLNDRLASSEREAGAIGQLVAQRPDPLPVLAALGALPPDATVLNLRAVGTDWQIDGRAADAAAIVALLAGNAQLEDVRFLSASSRFREDERTYETFSIAFRVRPAT